MDPVVFHRSVVKSCDFELAQRLQCVERPLGVTVGSRETRVPAGVGRECKRLLLDHHRCIQMYCAIETHMHAHIYMDVSRRHILMLQTKQSLGSCGFSSAVAV